MMRAHRADVHSLDTSHSAIILQLYAREIAQSIGHRVRVELLQQLALKLLTGHHLAHGRFRHDDYLAHMLYGVQLALCRRCHRQHASQCQCKLSLPHRLSEPPPPIPRVRHAAMVFIGRYSDLSSGHKRLPNNLSDIHVCAIKDDLQQRDCSGFTPNSLLISPTENRLLPAKIQQFCKLANIFAVIIWKNR